MATVRITFTRNHSQVQGPVCVAGRPIAEATGRDSGALPCEGVTFTSGTPVSGGNLNLWKTVVHAKSAVLVEGSDEWAARAVGGASHEAGYEADICGESEYPVTVTLLVPLPAALYTRLAQVAAERNSTPQGFTEAVLRHVLKG